MQHTPTPSHQPSSHPAAAHHLGDQVSSLTCPSRPCQRRTRRRWERPSRIYSSARGSPATMSSSAQRRDCLPSSLSWAAAVAKAVPTTAARNRGPLHASCSKGTFVGCTPAVPNLVCLLIVAARIGLRYLRRTPAPQLWNNDHAPDKVEAACRRSLAALKLARAAPRRLATHAATHIMPEEISAQSPPPLVRQDDDHIHLTHASRSIWTSTSFTGPL